MTLTAIQEQLVERWRRQIGRRRPYRRSRPLAALGFLRHSSARDCTFVELRHVLLVSLFDDPIGRSAPAMRLVGYGASQIDHGIEWSDCKFYKDLRIEPEWGASGLQIDSSQTELLHLALRMRAELYRFDRYYPRSARSEPQLPCVWAGFAPADAESLEGDGPEFHGLREKFDLSPEVLLRKFRREYEGLHCYPIEWMGGVLRRALRLFVDLDEMPRVQVFRVGSLPEGLIGFSGAAAYNFYDSRQREYYTDRLERSQQYTLAEREARNTLVST